jgi:hypothetical protein
MRPEATSVGGLTLLVSAAVSYQTSRCLRKASSGSSMHTLAYGRMLTYADVCTHTQVPAKSELWLLNSVPVERRAELLLDKGNKEVP